MIVLALVLVGGGGGAYALLSPGNVSGDSGLGEDQQLVAAQIGDLRNEVSTNGSVVFPNTENGSFGSDGTVGEVFVEVGDTVTEGQLLATLDESSVTSLEKSLAQAEVTLQKAEDDVNAALEPPTQLAVAMAESKVANATLSLRNAQEALVDLLALATEEDLAEARTNIESAETGLTNALDDLSISTRDWDRNIEDAASDIETFQTAYGDVFVKWLGIEPSIDDLERSVTELLAGWNIDLEAIFQTGESQDLAKGIYSSGPPLNDPATVWSEPTIYAWLNFYPGFLVVSCNDSFSVSQGSCILREMDQAQDAYELAKEALENVNNQAAKSFANSQSAVEKTRNTLGLAEDQLVSLLEESDALDIEVAEGQLAVAEATLATERDNLTDLATPVDRVTMNLLEADIADANASLDSAVKRLTGTTLTAPFDGFISVVNIAPGDIFRTNTNLVAIEIVDPTEAEVDGIVDEIDVLFVSVGAGATVAMDALPGTTLRGSVSSIDSAPRTQQGVVSYPIRIRIELPPGVQLRSGLSATANIVIREDPGVLLIPSQAVRGSFSEPYVLVSTDSGLRERAVQLGNSDDFWVSVTSGLSEGEQVVMDAIQASTDNNPCAVFRQASGFGGGGGFGGGRGGLGGGVGGFPGSRG